MKQNTYLLNTSRGPVIDEEALIQILKTQKIFEVSLEVFTKEPINLVNPLLKDVNLIVTLYVIVNLIDALKATALVVSQETIRILDYKVSKNLVN
jgi:phosphoglycerate dehydrogenase-like enzyme